jgi:FkbH-like protein
MSDALYASLGWLPKAPLDFRFRCRSITQVESDLGNDLRALASYCLDSNQLDHLAKIIEHARQTGRTLQPLIPFRLGLLSNSTVDFLVPALTATAARHGVALEVISCGYDQAVQEALSPDSSINRAKPDAVLVALDHRGLSLASSAADEALGKASIQRALDQLETIRLGIKKNCQAICILQTIALWPETLFGSLDAVLSSSLNRTIQEVNAGIVASVSGTRDVLLDVAQLANTVGLANWHSPAHWNMAKLSFSDDYCPLYAEHVCRIIGALRGKSRRALVLDLDNTVWGGVIGDDGLAGIQLAEGDAVGEAYRAVQRLALDLRRRGIVLAVCSKNEDETARLPFRKHPEMLLRENHIAVFQANWKDKPANIRAISEELSLGLESIVFLDDNPAERQHVRQALPQVAVPELPDDPALYARTLSAAGYFEAVVFSREDIARADFYQDNAKRIDLQRQSGDLDAYLRSLNMEITFQPFDETGRARIAQLINKSNQYNLTTRRYTEADVSQMQNDPACFTLQVRLSDIFGDNGMISVVVCREDGPDEWGIDTWLMSCRVLGRRVEHMVLKHITEQAKKRGIHKLKGTYIRTDRNKLVEDHYSRLGFVHVGGDGNGCSFYEFEVETASFEEVPITVVSDVA